MAAAGAILPWKISFLITHDSAPPNLALSHSYHCCWGEGARRALHTPTRIQLRMNDLERASWRRRGGRRAGPGLGF